MRSVARPTSQAHSRGPRSGIGTDAWGGVRPSPSERAVRGTRPDVAGSGGHRRTQAGKGQQIVVVPSSTGIVYRVPGVTSSARSPSSELVNIPLALRWVAAYLGRGFATVGRSATR